MSFPIIIGLNSAGWNSSSCLLIGGKPVFACEEERLVREEDASIFQLWA